MEPALGGMKSRKTQITPMATDYIDNSCQPAGGESTDMVVKTKKQHLLAHVSSLNGCGHTSRRAAVDKDIARDDFWFPRLYLLIIMRIASL